MYTVYAGMNISITFALQINNNQQLNLSHAPVATNKITGPHK